MSRKRAADGGGLSIIYGVPSKTRDPVEPKTSVLRSRMGQIDAYVPNVCVHNVECLLLGRLAYAAVGKVGDNRQTDDRRRDVMAQPGWIGVPLQVSRQHDGAALRCCTYYMHKCRSGSYVCTYGGRVECDVRIVNVYCSVHLYFFLLFRCSFASILQRYSLLCWATQNTSWLDLRPAVHITGAYDLRSLCAFTELDQQTMHIGKRLPTRKENQFIEPREISTIAIVGATHIHTHTCVNTLIRRCLSIWCHTHGHRQTH